MFAAPSSHGHRTAQTRAITSQPQCAALQSHRRRRAGYPRDWGHDVRHLAGHHIANHDRRMTRTPRLAALLAVVVLATACVSDEPQFRDPRGDGTPDIIGVSTRPTVDSVRLNVEFAAHFVVADDDLGVIIAEPQQGESPVCNAYMGPYVVMVPARHTNTGEVLYDGALVTEDPTAATGWSDPVSLDTTFDGRRVTVTVPLAMIGDPDVLYFAVLSTRVDGGRRDSSPDSFDAGTCHAAALAESPS